MTESKTKCQSETHSDYIADSSKSKSNN